VAPRRVHVHVVGSHGGRRRSLLGVRSADGLRRRDVRLPLGRLHAQALGGELRARVPVLRRGRARDGLLGVRRLEGRRDGVGPRHAAGLRRALPHRALRREAQDRKDRRAHREAAGPEELVGRAARGAPRGLGDDRVRRGRRRRRDREVGPLQQRDELRRPAVPLGAAGGARAAADARTPRGALRHGDLGHAHFVPRPPLHPSRREVQLSLAAGRPGGADTLYG